jgi:carboxypeptidase C (cathepsin A)
VILIASVLIAALFQSPTIATAQEPPKQWASDHTININGRTINYKATASFTPLTDERNNQKLSIFSVEYTQNDVASDRPVTFLYNGGPGSSSVWLHLGTFGPKRVLTTQAAATPPAPYKLIDNTYCLLDRTDMVFIDPIGTGFSHAATVAQDRDYWNIDQDVKMFAQFIAAYLRTHNRWNSPKFLIGESYGAFRSAALADYLYAHDSIQLNGIVMISPVLDISTLASFNPSADLPYVLSLPTYAAVAWHYKLVKDPPVELTAFLTQARQFASGEYANALRKGWKLADLEKDNIVKALSHLTGLDEEYLIKANLRVSSDQFASELESKHGLRLGSFDARFSSPNDHLPIGGFLYDPSYAAVTGAFTSAINSYLHDALGIEANSQYIVVSSDAPMLWDWKHNPTSSIPVLPNVREDLTHAMIANPYLRVQIEIGYFDLVAPFLATEYTVDHLNLPAHAGSKMIRENYYPAGHMMYLEEQQLAKLKESVASLVDSASK